MLRLLSAGGSVRGCDGMPRLRVSPLQCCYHASCAVDDDPADADPRVAAQVMAGRNGFESGLSQELANVTCLTETMLEHDPASWLESVARSGNDALKTGQAIAGRDQR